MKVRRLAVLLAFSLALTLGAGALAMSPAMIQGPGPVQPDSGYTVQAPGPVVSLMNAYAVVVRGPLNVHSEPDANAPVIGSLAMGASVHCTGYVGDNWVQVSLGDTLGYAYRLYLSFGGTPAPQPTAQPQHHRKAQTTGANATVHTHKGGPLHLRQDAAQKTAIVDTYENGSRVRVMSQKEGWYYVQADQKTGYMDAQYIVLDPGASLADEHADVDAVVANPGAHQVLRLRQTPSEDARILGTYENGTYVQVLAVGTDWMHVICDGKEGFMSAQFLHIVSGDATAQRTVVSDAEDHVALYSNGSSADVLALVPVGAGVTVKVPDTDWSEVVYQGDGPAVTGYLRNENLAAEAPEVEALEPTGENENG